mmetsp:Transcript_54029/g.167234  ORF Transcript_54029/g.167234 Transcript_54029/m.167234 type:complete len:86 (-) Transcript_54029:293-550(-)
MAARDTVPRWWQRSAAHWPAVPAVAMAVGSSKRPWHTLPQKIDKALLMTFSTTALGGLLPWDKVSQVLMLSEHFHVYQASAQTGP